MEDIESIYTFASNGSSLTAEYPSAMNIDAERTTTAIGNKGYKG
jgi:hypothetical protein